MAKRLNDIIGTISKTTLPIDRFCNIKTYISVKEKFEFIEEYKDVLKEHECDAKDPEMLNFIAFIFFNLMVVKKYTDIDLDLTYEEFDMLQENGVTNKIVEKIGDDYSLLLQFVNLYNKK